MKILLSAYACEPNKGSEPGIGWHWAIELARLGHEVWALTRESNRPTIEAELGRMPPIPNLHFLYYDLPRWVRWWKRGNRGIYLYYLLWQWGAYQLARREHARERFDRVHHITFGGVRQPSFMGNLGIPFVFGPVAGGERAPWRLRFGYGLRGFILDAVRDTLNFLVRVDPLMRRTFAQAERIYLTSEQTRGLVPRSFRHKSMVQLAIGYQRDGTITECKAREVRSIRFLYVGRFICWKGMYLGLPAFARLLKAVPDARLTLVGKGPDETRWRRLADTLGISEQIEWIEWVDRTKLPELYAQHDVFLFPSLHDSGGMVVLEAMGHGLPIICLDLGGPAVMVDDSCGRIIKTKGAGKTEVVQALGDALIDLAKDVELRIRLSEGALGRVQEYEWSTVVRRLYSEVSAQ